MMKLQRLLESLIFFAIMLSLSIQTQASQDDFSANEQACFNHLVQSVALKKEDTSFHQYHVIIKMAPGRKGVINYITTMSLLNRIGVEFLNKTDHSEYFDAHSAERRASFDIQIYSPQQRQFLKVLAEKNDIQLEFTRSGYENNISPYYQQLRPYIATNHVDLETLQLVDSWRAKNTNPLKIEVHQALYQHEYTYENAVQNKNLEMKETAERYDVDIILHPPSIVGKEGERHSEVVGHLKYTFTIHTLEQLGLFEQLVKSGTQFNFKIINN